MRMRYELFFRDMSVTLFDDGWWAVYNAHGYAVDMGSCRFRLTQWVRARWALYVRQPWRRWVRRRRS